MGRLTRDGTAEPVSRDQILRHERGQGNIHFSCSAGHVQDWQPYPVDPYSCYMCDHTYIHTNGQHSWGFFRDAQGFGRLDAGSRAGFTSSRPPPHHGSRCFNFPYFCMMYGLEKLGLVDQNWLVRNLSALLLWTLVVGRWQQSESIEVSLDVEEGLMNRFDIGQCHFLQSPRKATLLA